jgi:2'-5' RNA ligase
MGQTVIAYWLIPAEPAQSFFQRMIDNLARRYDAPVFEPHVTIHVGADDPAAAETALREAAHKCTLIRLTPRGIDHSDEFIKTLFVQFAMNPELRHINDVLRKEADDSSKYQVKPHLSLLYKNLPAPTRTELASSITVPFAQITFDVMQAIRCISPTRNRADVEAWELIYASRLR